MSFAVSNTTPQLSPYFILQADSHTGKHTHLFFLIFENLNKADCGNLLAVNQWLNRCVTPIAKTLFPFPNFINFSNPNNLKGYLADNFKSPEFLSSATMIAKRVYESKQRSVAENNGEAFPMDAEVLAYAMKLARGEEVLEIAAASGENAILLALAGAKRVYVNEIVDKEMDIFEGLVAKLPKNLRKKLTSIRGSCFDILQKEAKIKQTVGLVLCRNLLHFFTDKQQGDFFQLLKVILKPGGQAIFTVNSVYLFINSQDLFEKNPDCTAFTFTQCYYSDFITNTSSTFHYLLSPCSDQKIAYPFQNFCLYERSQKTEGKWKANPSQFSRVPQEIKTSIQGACQKAQVSYAPIKEGRVTALIDSIRLYSRKNLKSLLRNFGFQIECTFVTDTKGHLIHDSNLYTQGVHLGIVVKSIPIRSS